MIRFLKIILKICTLAEETGWRDVYKNSCKTNNYRRKNTQAVLKPTEKLPYLPSNLESAEWFVLMLQEELHVSGHISFHSDVTQDHSI